MSDLDALHQRLKGLSLNHMAGQMDKLIGQAEANELSYLQFAQNITKCELQGREARRLNQNRKLAGFPVEKRLAEFDYRFQTTITKKQVNQLLDFSFIDNRSNLIFIGPPGVGKTHLAIGIGLQAIEAGYKVLFTTALGLIEMLEVALLKGELKQKINQLCKNDVVIIDELGYLPMNRQSNHNLFQLINALYEYRAVILTTNKEFAHWGEFFTDENVAVPIVDRLIHHSHIFMLGGESYRLKQKMG